MYTLVVLIGLVVVGAFIDGFVIGRRRSCVVFAVALTGLLYTHNWALYVAIAAAAALVPSALASERPRQVLRDGGLALVAVGVAYAPWLVVLVGQIGDTGAPWSYTPTAREVIWEVSALVRDERVFLLLAVVAGGSLAQVVLRPKTIEGAITWVLVTFTVVPVTLGWAIAHVEPSWATRYLAVVVAPMLVLAGWGLSRAGAVGLLALVVAVGLWVQPLARLEGGLRIEPHGKSDGRALAAELDTQLAQGDLVIVAQPEAVPLFDLYMDRDVRFATVYGGVIDDPQVMDWRGAPAELAAAEPQRELLPLLRDLRPGQPRRPRRARRPSGAHRHGLDPELPPPARRLAVGAALGWFRRAGRPGPVAPDRRRGPLRGRRLRGGRVTTSGGAGSDIWGEGV